MLQVQYDQVITVFIQTGKAYLLLILQNCVVPLKCETKLDVPPQHLTPSLHRLQYPTPSSISFVSLFLLRLKYAQNNTFSLGIVYKVKLGVRFVCHFENYYKSRQED